MKDDNMSEKMIAICGLDCAVCKARIATVNNDAALRDSFAKELSELNGFPITSEMIACEGCIGNGLKSQFCENMCEIRKCAQSKHFKTCGDCDQISTCKTLRMMPGHTEEIIANLKHI